MTEFLRFGPLEICRRFSRQFLIRGLNLKSRSGYCSWCGEFSKHDPTLRKIARRHIYECSNCGRFTLKCSFCNNMVRGGDHGVSKKEFVHWFEENYPGETIPRKDSNKRCELEDRVLFEKEKLFEKASKDFNGFKKFSSTISKNWDNILCSEHDGKVNSFKRLSYKIDDLEDYKYVYLKREKVNLQKVSMVAGGLVAGVGVFGPIYYFAAAPLASSLGAAGFLGATKTTGVAIALLSGAALQNASLAALGGGALAVGGVGMAGGAVFISAVGAGLGSVAGGMVSNSYIGQIKDFSITKEKSGTGPALIFINGFLSQKKQDSSDWQKAVDSKFPDNPRYYITWESKALSDIGSLFNTLKGKALQVALGKLGKKVAIKGVKAINPMTWPFLVKDLLANPWHTALVKSSMTGVVLADMIARTNSNDGFILMGHSLGSRVILNTLLALSTKDSNYIQDVYLLGGAVGREDRATWKSAKGAVSGKIYNYFSSNDRVIRHMYQNANIRLSDPIGLNEIKYQNKDIINVNVSDKIKGFSGHMQYKNKFKGMLKNIYD